MINNDWNRFGDDIRMTIQDAIERGDYTRLNQTITNTVNQAADWVNRNVSSLGNQNRGNVKYNSPNYNSVHEVKNDRTERLNPALYASKPVSMSTSIVKIALGSSIGLGVFIFTLVAAIGSMLGGNTVTGFVLLGIMLVSTFVSGKAVQKGIQALTRLKRYRTYLKELGTAEFCKIVDLADAVHKTTKFVVKELEFMIDKEWFREGHLDKQKTCLIVSNNMYKKYAALEMRHAEEQKKKLEEQEQRKGLSEEVQKVIAQGDAYVKRIRECNDAIPGEEISAKISHMEMVVDKIFDRVENDPSLVDDLGKLMDYYLPTTIKLLEAYEQMDKQPVKGENIESSKREIEATLDTLNTAFEKLLDSLFQAAAWDVSSDISVLNTMLAQEGLKGDGLKK